jgi:hypothetical protein
MLPAAARAVQGFDNQTLFAAAPIDTRGSKAGCCLALYGKHGFRTCRCPAGLPMLLLKARMLPAAA